MELKTIIQLTYSHLYTQEVLSLGLVHHGPHGFHKILHRPLCFFQFSLIFHAIKHSYKSKFELTAYS